ncbi:MAG: sulfur carrier protein ThiS [Actinomycetota bacterium]|nr:sulfur carrier protein ThiS [Actinomycetota bacterium]
MRLRVTVNGEAREVSGDATISDLVRRLGRDPLRSGVAVAINGTVVPRETWPERRLAAGDQVEVLGAVQGG